MARWNCVPLHYFLTVAREQSISAAAESLHISQPALSHPVERDGGGAGETAVAIRGTKGSRRVVLTEEGMILRRRAEEILSLVQKAEEDIEPASDETIAGDVVIGAGETDNVRLLAQSCKGPAKAVPRYSLPHLPAATRSTCWNIWIRG